MNAQEIVDEFNHNVSKFQNGEVLAKGAITGVLEKACGGKENRYLVLKELTGYTSSKKLSEAQWYGLLCLVQPHKPQGGHWTTQRGKTDLQIICGALLARHAMQDGQIAMFSPSETLLQP